MTMTAKGWAGRVMAASGFAALLGVACSPTAPGGEDPASSARGLGAPPAPVFTRAYSGAKSGRADRRWSWEPAANSPAVDKYYVKPSWADGFYTTETTYRHSESYDAYRWHNPMPLAAGVYTLSVQAANAYGTSPPTVDALEISYFIDPALAAANDMGKQDMGLAGCEVHFDPGQEVTDAVAIRYKFHVVAPDGVDGTKILFGGTRVSGPAGNPYAMEQQFYTRRPSYADPICDTQWFTGTYLEDETSVAIKIADYVTKGKPGIKTFAPTMFPRQYSLIDGVAGVTSYSMTSQTDIAGKEGQVELVRGDLVTDKDGWKCTEPLATDDFREWKATVTLDGTPYEMSSAIPELSARYLSVNGMQNFRTEFFLMPGYVKFYFWDVQIQREGSVTWEPLNKWKVGEFVGYTSDFGVRMSTYKGARVIELSNDSPGAFFPKDYVFDLSTACLPTSCAAQGKSCGPLSDGCGGTLECGSCPAQQACGAGGVVNVCGGASSSTPTCQATVTPSGGVGDSFHWAVASTDATNCTYAVDGGASQPILCNASGDATGLGGIGNHTAVVSAVGPGGATNCSASWSVTGVSCHASVTPSVGAVADTFQYALAASGATSCTYSIDGAAALPIACDATGSVTGLGGVGQHVSTVLAEGPSGSATCAASWTVTP